MKHSPFFLLLFFLHYSSLGSKDDGDCDGNENGKKQQVSLAKQQLCTCITLFCTFFSTWKCLVLRFVEDVNKRHQLSFSFLELWYCRPLKFKSKKICQHLTNWTRWNKRDKVWGSANSLHKWRFRSRRPRFWLSSLLTKTRRPRFPKFLFTHLFRVSTRRPTIDLIFLSDSRVEEIRVRAWK